MDSFCHHFLAPFYFKPIDFLSSIELLKGEVEQDVHAALFYTVNVHIVVYTVFCLKGQVHRFSTSFVLLQ